MTLNALKTIHSLNIVHTDVKLDNILFANERFALDSALEKYLEENPSQVNPDTQIPESQPIPNEWTYETSAFQAERMTVALIDFGHAEWTEGTPLGDGFCPLFLRPPEVLLSSGFGTAIDIWMIGCLTFELLVGRSLFHPEDGGDDWSIDEDHLAKMMELTDQRFSTTILDRAKNRAKYFDAEGEVSSVNAKDKQIHWCKLPGNLINIKDLIPVKIEKAMRNYNIPGLSQEDITESADFIRSCLHLDHEKRPTADELVKHSFLMKAFHC
ncbi:hypothetical protein CVT24_006694 [Panaeolus cyanescens]|uniref:non-specific serine/threonine protein kinase n=1 Tax=Panaeolus cyanescens TaxID=181874 RepID=A0A409X167_9AGAR|nr:hypothetical protein CVT24_006694 [Panaeolus cyanescens]